MTEHKYPEEGKSPEIGQMAVRAFEVSHPYKEWRPTSLDGDNDYGDDYWIQVLEDGKARYSFFLQLKGSKEIKEGKSAKLSNDGSYYSQKLELSTLNKFYADIVPIMLVFADLCQDEDPRKCKVYYRWLDEETLNEIINKKIDQETSTFRIPVKDILDNNVDVLSYLKQFEKKHKTLNVFWDSIPESNVRKDKIQIVNAISNRFSSNPAIVDSIIKDDDDPWYNAPKNSLAFKLRQISNDLNAYNLDSANENLNKITSDQISGASKHENAEIHYLRAKIVSMTDEGDFCLEHYEKANKAFPENDKYRIAYLENKINCNRSNNAIIQDVIEELKQKDSIKATLVKAKAYALLNNIESLNVLSQLPEKEAIVSKPLCLFLLKKYKECSDFVKKQTNINNKNKIKLNLFLIKSLFNLGYGKVSDYPNNIIPYAGTPNMNIPILQECWEYIKDTWELVAKIGFPYDISYIINESCVLGMYFEDINAIYPHLVTFADKYQKLEYFQQAVLSVCLSKDDFSVVERLFSRINSDDIYVIMYKIDYEYRRQNYDEVARLVFSNLNKFCRQKPFGFDAMLLRGIECAEKSLMIDEKNAIVKKIQQLPNSQGILASYHFFEEINKSQLNGEKALDELYKTFEEGCDHPQVLNLLIQNLNSVETANSTKIINIIQKIEGQRPLQNEEFNSYANALIVSEEWGELLEKVENQICHYPNDVKLLSIKALALDQKGETPKALHILTNLMGKSISDKFTLEVSLNVFLRCGFSEQAKKLLTKLLPKANNTQEKLSLLKLLYNIEMRNNSVSPLLIEYCFKYGKLANQDDIEEEGLFLQLAWMLIINPNIKIPKENNVEFQKRLKEYTIKFPESIYIREVKFPKTASGEQLLKIIENITGSVSRTEKLKEYESKIKAGKLLVPFSIRHNYLPSIIDLLHLWQTMKQTNQRYTQYQLAISDTNYELKDVNYVLEKTPLIDELSLILLNDLDLLPYLFDIFEEVIITKATIGRLFNWGQSPISPYSNIARKITDILRIKIDQIIQPTCKSGDNFSFNMNDLLEYGNVLKERNNSIFYSDDGLARYFIYQKEYKTKGMTTVDLLEVIREKGILSDKDVAEKYAKLCAWNIVGLSIKFLDILSVISEEFKGKESIEECLKKLDANKNFTKMVNAIWFPNKSYFGCLVDIASLICICLEDDQGKYKDDLISAIWINWYYRVLLKGNLTKEADFVFLSDSFFLTAFILVTSIEKGRHILVSSRLWTIYNSVANDLFPKIMVGDIKYQAIKIIALRIAHVKDYQTMGMVHRFVISGIEKQHPDASIYNQEFFRFSE